MILQGKKIVSASTVNSMYANGKIALRNKEREEYRIDVNDILKLIQKEKFNVTMKRKYNHLTLAE